MQKGDECFSLVNSTLEMVSERFGYHYSAMAVPDITQVLNSVHTVLEEMLFVHLLFH